MAEPPRAPKLLCHAPRVALACLDPPVGPDGADPRIFPPKAGATPALSGPHTLAGGQCNEKKPLRYALSRSEAPLRIRGTWKAWTTHERSTTQPVWVKQATSWRHGKHPAKAPLAEVCSMSALCSTMAPKSLRHGWRAPCRRAPPRHPILAEHPDLPDYTGAVSDRQTLLQMRDAALRLTGSSELRDMEGWSPTLSMSKMPACCGSYERLGPLVRLQRGPLPPAMQGDMADIAGRTVGQPERAFEVRGRSCKAAQRPRGTPWLM